MSHVRLTSRGGDPVPGSGDLLDGSGSSHGAARIAAPGGAPAPSQAGPGHLA